jgi:hypothetical protein
VIRKRVEFFVASRTSSPRVCDRRASMTFLSQSTSADGPSRRSPLTAYGEAVLHLLLITVENDTPSLHAIDAAGREFDGAVIKRGTR